MILFLHIEKTAGTSLAHYLKGLFGTKMVDLYPIENHQYVTDSDIDFALKLNPKAQILTSHSLELDKINLERFDKVISIIRDPLKRCYSHYIQLSDSWKEIRLSFPDFYKNEELVNMQSRRLGCKNKDDITNLLNDKKVYILKTENFDEQFRKLFNQGGEAPKKNIRNKKVDLKTYEKGFDQMNELDNQLFTIYNEQNEDTLYQKGMIEFSELFQLKNVDKSNFRRRYYNLVLYQLKSFVSKGKFFRRNNMAGYYLYK